VETQNIRKCVGVNLLVDLMTAKKQKGKKEEGREEERRKEGRKKRKEGVWGEIKSQYTFQRHSLMINFLQIYPTS
jgi:hypothetical protein